MRETQLFLVRVWQHHSEFRASVRAVDDGEPRLFTEPVQVGEFLRAASALSAAPGAQENGGRHEDPV